MHDIFIYRLTTCFTASIIIWAIFSYIDIWINQNLRSTSKLIAKLLNSEQKPESFNTPGYSITQGVYKGRKIVCRMNSFSPSNFLKYNLRLHIHIEPLVDIRSRPNEAFSPTENTQIAGNKIIYKCTSLTAMKSYFLSAIIAKEEFVEIFEELTQAAETVEINAR